MGFVYFRVAIYLTRVIINIINRVKDKSVHYTFR